MVCLDENAVVDFIEGRLEPSRRDHMENHLAGCAQCRRLVARTAEALLPTGAAGEKPLKLPAPLRGLVPDDIVGRYRVLHRVGAGAMGVVYAAEDQELRRKVALKLLRADPSQSSDKLGARLLREARAASVIRHPNVVPVHDVFTLEDGSPVLVMDLLVGEPFRTKIERDGPLDIQQTAQVLLPVLSALEAAHALGIVHRDLKPDNIFLSTTDMGELDVKIVDFGVAKLTAVEGPAARTAGLTESGLLVGTPFYMSPEQAFGEKQIDARTDLWAVGIILYECLAGSRPTQADNVGQVLKILAHLSFPPIEQMVPDIPPRLASLVAGLLCEREHRISSASQVKRELIALLEDQSAPARTAEILPKRRITSHPFYFVVALLVFAALTGFWMVGSSPSISDEHDAGSQSVVVVHWDSSPTPGPVSALPSSRTQSVATDAGNDTAVAKVPSPRIMVKKDSAPSRTGDAQTESPDAGRAREPPKLMMDPPF